MTRAAIARLRADLAAALLERDDTRRRWAVARYTASGSARTEDLDVALARLDATVAELEERLSDAGPALGGQTDTDTTARDTPAKAPSCHQDQLSGAPGYLPSPPPLPGDPEPTPDREPEYLTAREAAALLRLSVDTLERLRRGAGGPPYKRVGRRVLYSRAELLAFGTRR